MSRKRKPAPSSPEAIMELRAARLEAERIEAIGGTARVAHEKQDDGSMKWGARARRLDVFALLLSRKALDTEAYDAFRGHEETVHIAAGYGTPERRPDHIRASTEGAPGQNIGQGMVDASRIVKGTLARLSPSEAGLLEALMKLGASRNDQWRRTVQLETGETNDHGQTSRIRALGENLIHARKAAIKAHGRAANDDRRAA